MAGALKQPPAPPGVDLCQNDIYTLLRSTEANGGEPDAPRPEVPVRASSCVGGVLLLWAAVGANAQPTTVTTQPAAPAASSPVTIVLFNPCNCPMYGTPIVRNGFTFDIPYGPACLSACLPATRTYDVGFLPEGTYTVRHFFEGSPETAEVIGSFMVGPPIPPPIPALGTGSLALLSVLLAASAVLVLRRLAG